MYERYFILLSILSPRFLEDAGKASNITLNDDLVNGTHRKIFKYLPVNILL